MTRKNLVIIICGPSGSGKTTFCNALAKKIGGIPLHLDNLFLGHNYVNYDNPLMIAKAAGIIARKVADFEDKPVICDFLFYKEGLRKAFKYDVCVLLKVGKDMRGFEESDINYTIFVQDAENEAEKFIEFLNKT
jgi:adenylate kinase family enzyme